MASAEESTEGEEKAVDKEAVAAEFRRMKAPNKKRLEDDIEVLMTQIKEKESQLKANNSKSDERNQEEGRNIRAEKEANNERRKKKDAELRQLGVTIRSQLDSLAKVQAQLTYKREDRINEAIRRLEYQLKNQNFSLREEKKIVSEIDSLKRSKKALVQYTAMKRELDSLRDKQRRIREEIGHYSKAVTGLKNREGAIRNSFKAMREHNEQLRKEIDALFDEKRKMIADFKKYENEYYNCKRITKEVQSKKREEEKRAQLAAKQKEIAEIEALREPYEQEKQLCTTLIVYLQRFLSQETTQDNQQDTPSTPDAVKAVEKEAGMFVLRRKKSDEDDVFWGAGRGKAGKRNKKDKKKISVPKHIQHSPEIFAQFDALNLTAPSTMTEVQISIEQLQARKAYYQNAPAIVPSQFSPTSQVSTDWTISEATSHTGSLVSVTTLDSTTSDGSVISDVDLESTLKQQDFQNILVSETIDDAVEERSISPIEKDINKDNVGKGTTEGPGVNMEKVPSTTLVMRSISSENDGSSICSLDNHVNNAHDATDTEESGIELDEFTHDLPKTNKQCPRDKLKLHILKDSNTINNAHAGNEVDADSALNNMNNCNGYIDDAENKDDIADTCNKDTVANEKVTQCEDSSDKFDTENLVNGDVVEES
ncbi:unnamed protein product [Owenia fusiformis]|uniref:Uncharacterized protein n=1 Tax=Owenia fusiformis TaxID=6347 RepID=A0A8J1UBU4_OWEFU|nr:unnamed protein product [Owenia fusiformis]